MKKTLLTILFVITISLCILSVGSQTKYLLGMAGIITFQFVDPKAEFAGNSAVCILPLVIISYIIYRTGKKMEIDLYLPLLATFIAVPTLLILMSLTSISQNWTLIFLMPIFIILGIVGLRRRNKNMAKAIASDTPLTFNEN